MTTTRDRERLDAPTKPCYITGQILGVDGGSILHA